MTYMTHYNKVIWNELAKMKHTIQLILKQLHIPKKGNILKVLLCLKNNSKLFIDIDLLNNFGPFIHYVRQRSSIRERSAVI